MTLLHVIESVVVALLVGAGGGWWAKGRYAAKIAADLAKVATKV